MSNRLVVQGCDCLCACDCDTVIPQSIQDDNYHPPRQVIWYITLKGPYGGEAGPEYFKRIEFVLALCLLFDIIARMLTSRNIPRFLVSYYTLIDIAAYVSIAYYYVFVFTWSVR